MQPNWFVALEAVPHPSLEFPPPAAGIRLLHPADYHITIAFFGPLAAAPTEVLADRLPQLSNAPHHSVAQRAIMLPRQEWASVIALEFDSDELRQFIATWRDQLRAAVGLPSERRSILPHLTIARMKPTRIPVLIEERQRWAEKLTQQLPHPFRFTAVGLYTWQERILPHQPRYRMILRSALSDR